MPSRQIHRRAYLATSLAASSALLLRRSKSLFAQDRVSQNAMRIISETPFNAESPLRALVKNYFTKTEEFYVRSNGPVPTLGAGGHKIVIEGLVERPLALTLSELQAKFAKMTRNATLMCAGNRRTEMSEIKKISGTPWMAGAVGNAAWAGADLASVLRQVGLKPDAKHVWFESLDRCPIKTGGETPFGASIPINKALDGTTLLAWEMNQEPLTPDHGFPLRVVVPGYIGARSVKWLGKIIVSDRPSPNWFVADNYKIVPSTGSADLARTDPLGEVTINSLICSPLAGEKVPAGKVLLKGIALPAGGRCDRIRRVVVQSAEGKMLAEAKLQAAGEAFCWEQWTAEVELRPGMHTLAVRAFGLQGDEQPLTGNWNALGYLYNAPHRVTFEVA